MAVIALGAIAASSIGSATIGAAAASAALIAAGSYIDGRLILPGLLGSRRDARPQRFLELQQPTSDQGSPRIIAFGSDGVRLPVHAMLMEKRQEERTSGSTKTGRITRTEVYSKTALAISERMVSEMLMLVADGKLLYYPVRNLQRIRSRFITTSVSGGNLVIEATSTECEAFGQVFDVDDCVKLSYFSTANNGYWKVVATTPHGSALSTMEVAPLAGQTPAAGGGGSALSPSLIEREDGRLVDSAYVFTILAQNFATVTQASTSKQDPRDVFESGDVVVFSGVLRSNATVVDGGWRVVRFDVDPSTSIVTMRVVSLGTAGVTGVGTWGTGAYARRADETLAYDTRLLTDTPTFYRGTPTQSIDPTIEDLKGTAYTPSFPSLAYIVLDELNQTEFGNRLPVVEAIVRPDFSLGFGDAIREIMRLSRMPAVETVADVSGVPFREVRGYYVSGSQPVIQHMQPLMLAESILTQERGESLAFFSVENCDQVGVETADLAAREEGESLPADVVEVTDAPVDDLPTSVGVSFQDSTLNFGRGYEHFGMRSPTGADHANHLALDLRPLSMTRTQARDLAGSVLRRAWINRRELSLQLPPSYCYLLENDIVNVDALDRTWSVRLLRVDVGDNKLVKCSGVVEDVTIKVEASPTNSTAGQRKPSAFPATVLSAHVLEMPAFLDEQAHIPGVFVCATAEDSDAWSGAVVFVSDDDVAYRPLVALSLEIPVGEIQSTLPAGSTITWDTTNSVSLRLLGSTSLQSETRARVLQGFNRFLVRSSAGDELIGASSAVQNADGSWTLSDLLRGLRDTDSLSHPADGYVIEVSRFAIPGGTAPSLETGRFLAHEHGRNAIGQTRYYKIVPTGGLVADATAITHVVAAETMRPFRPGDLAVSRDGSNNAKIVWSHRPRGPGPNFGNPPPPPEETVEVYDVYVFTDNSYTTVVRQFIVTADGSTSPLVSRQVLYSAALQTSDGLTPGNPLSIRIYQRSTLTGLISRMAETEA